MKNTATAIAVFFVAGAANSAPVDLSTWLAEGPGNWSLAGDNNSVFQSLNGNPTVFHNNTASSQNKALSGTITVETTADDDYIGFVLGYNAGDLLNAAADYLLIDWKQANQGSFGCNADVGLSISHVSGALGNNAGAWCHDPAGNVTELARASTLGSTGWLDNTTYSFDLIFTGSLVEVKVNGVTEISLAGSFADGGFGFYNYSQQGVRYAGIGEEVVVDPPSPVPLPAALPMLGAALGLLAAAAARRRRA